MPKGTLTSRRYLTLLEIADLVALDESLPRRERRRRLERQFRAFERRDGTTYLHKTNRTSPFKVCVEDLHLLDPYNPSTTARLREDIDALSLDNKRLRRRVLALEDFCERANAYLKQLAQANPQFARGNLH